uniref:Uncharacterized protein n=1 Tax=Arundo donax TaxID=35708 RepID=A0A0A9D0H6_ARUDO
MCIVRMSTPQPNNHQAFHLFLIKLPLEPPVCCFKKGVLPIQLPHP